MGTTENWQTMIESAFDINVFNQSSWVQGIENQEFKEQVQWELSAMLI